MDQLTTFTMIREAAKKTFVPWLRIVVFSFLILSIVGSLLIRMPVFKYTVDLQRWLAIHSLYLLFGGLPMIALGLGFVSLLALKPIKERALILTLMFCLAWLTRGYQFYV